jgi:magnesium-protoporphyrin O-methyltransferase
MPTLSYLQRRAKIETYFDSTAVEAWKRLTSDAPVGRIRATVRAGRDRMRATLLDQLPADMTGQRLLDAGCGTGALALEAARRGADVLAIDLSPNLVQLAADRTRGMPLAGSLTFKSGDMLDARHGRFDHVVAMDSFIHYSEADIVEIIARLAARTNQSILFTVAPRTPFLAAMIKVGRMLPSANRSPWLEPVHVATLVARLGEQGSLRQWTPKSLECVRAGFYTSQAMELKRS